MAGGAFRGGLLMHRVTIELPAPGKAADGSPNGEYVPVATGIPALVEEMGARDVVEARKADGRITSIVRLRYRGDLTGRHRFDFRGRKLNILGAPVNPDGRRVEHRCFCSEATGG